MKAVVLLSGGVDSCVALYLALQHERAVRAVGVDYGQRAASCELEAARAIAACAEVPFDRVRVSAAGFGGALVGACEVPVGRSAEEIALDGAPRTIVPGRNAMLLSIASALVVAGGGDEVFIGANADDGRSYRDCVPSFFRAFELMAASGGVEVRVRHPLTALSKRGVVLLGRACGAPLEKTWSCYAPRNGEPCEACDACALRDAAW